MATMNAQLTRSLSGEDVRHAVFQMNPSKVPRPDGFMVGFL